MKKILSLAILIVAVISLSACSGDKEYYTKEEVDKLVNDLKFTDIQQFLLDSLEYVGEYEFIELNTEYNDTVEAFEISKIYIYKVEEETTFKIKIKVDNDLEMVFSQFSLYAQQENGYEELKPSLSNVYRTYTTVVEEGYLIIELESYDMEKDSEYWFVVEEEVN